MTDVDEITVFCEGPSDAPHQRLVLHRYARQAADPPQWWRMPSLDALVMENAPGAYESASWPRLRAHFTLRCPNCRLHVKRTLDRDYGNDYPPLSAALERMRAAGLNEISGRSLDHVVAWTRSRG